MFLVVVTFCFTSQSPFQAGLLGADGTVTNKDLFLNLGSPRGKPTATVGQWLGTVYESSNHLVPAGNNSEGPLSTSASD